MKLLLDMNLSPRWVEILRQAGHEAVHWSTVGRAVAEDHELMAWARTHGHVVVTNDLDFGAILAATEAVSPRSIGDRLLEALARFERDLLAGALITVDERRERARLLPIKPQREEPAN